MKENKIKYDRILTFLNKWFYSFYFPIILLILIYFLEQYKIKNLILSIILYFVIIIFWVIKLTYVPKNKSVKYGIVFLIDNNTYYNDNRNLFFKKLNFNLEKHFKILIINKNCLKKYDTEEKKAKIMNKKNYQMIINTFAMDTKSNNECVCSLDNKSVTFSTPISKLDEITMKNLQTDFNKGFHKIIKLRQKEAFDDINENTDLMANSIRYLVSIIFIIFGNLSEAENLLGEIDLTNLSPSNKIVQYLRNSIVRRYIDIHFIYSVTIINKTEYLYNEKVLQELEKHVLLLEKLIQSNCNHQNYLIDFYDMKSKLLFAQNNYHDSLGIIIKMNRKVPSDYIILLSLGFIYIIINNIPKGIEYYKKVSKRKDVDIKKIDECINFIKSCLKSEKYNSINLKICLGILIFYWKDREEGKITLESVLYSLENEEVKKYIQARYT